MTFVRGTNLGNTGTIVTVGTKQAYVFNALGGGTSLQLQLPVDAPLGPTTLTAGASVPFNITLVQYCPDYPWTAAPSDRGITLLPKAGDRLLPGHAQ